MRRAMVKTTRVLSVLLLAAVPFACTTMSTYPPTAGKSISTPNNSPGPEVMAGAIKEASRISGHTGPIVFNLPAGLAANTWSRVQSLLGDGARPMNAGETDAFSVQQLRLDGGLAEVDVVYPERGVYQLMKVKLKGGAIGPWRVDWSYRWVIPAAAPIANGPRVDLAPGELAPKTEIVGEVTPTSAATEAATPSAQP